MISDPLSAVTAVAPCPVCGSSDRVLALKAVDRQFGLPGQHEVWRCQRCGLGQTLPHLGPAELSAAYPAQYTCYHLARRESDGMRRRLSETMLAALGYPQPAALPLARVIGRMLAAVRCWTWCPPPAPPGRLLDVGCGSGHYGASLIALGWQVDGIEPDAQAAERARKAGLNVQARSVAEARLMPNTYDVITLWHVLEHIDDPVAALEVLAKALRPTGRMVVETPNWGGAIAAWAQADWFHLDAPRHRVHFTPESLRIALNSAGYQVESLRHIPNPHGFAGSIAYRWRRSLHGKRPVVALGWLTGMVTASVRRGDVIRATARLDL